MAAALTSTGTGSSSQRFAFVTLITTDSYLPGALVLAHTLRQAHSPAGKPAGTLTPADLANLGSSGLSKYTSSERKVDLVCLVTPATVSVRTIKTLVRYFDKVVGVEPLSFASLAAAKANERSDPRNRRSVEAKAARRVRAESRKKLALLGRPDLGEGAGAALTKLHAWRLTGYNKVVYLDADILVLRPIAHLFSISSALAASPDIGWPDAFNSGLMVLTPSLSTFAAMREFAIQRGSWDGADQGLLNDFFGEERGLGENAVSSTGSVQGQGWQRLPFRYNVTPNAGYMFIPAYQRYGAGIMTAHFIGPHKPWNRPKPNPPPSRSGRPGDAIGPVDHESMLHRWHEAFEECFPQIARHRAGLADVIHTERGVEVIERPFTVPSYKAVWDLEGDPAMSGGDANAAKRGSLRAVRQRAPSAASIFRGAGQAEDLKQMFSPAVVAASAVAELDSLARDVEARPNEGIYVSLPLDSRTSLMAAQMDSGDESPDSDDTPTGQSGSYQQGQQQQQQQQQQHQQQGETRSGEWSPPKTSWDPARGPPPSGGGKAEYQMRDPVDTFYVNAWDQPLSEQRKRRPAHNDGLQYNDASRARALSRLQAEHFFDNLGSEQPDVRKVKPVFPWESTSSNGSGSSRVFPDEEPSSVVPGSQDMTASLRAGSTADLGSSAGDDTSPERQVGSGKGFPATLNYANAWDQLKAGPGTAAGGNRSRVVQAQSETASRTTQTGVGKGRSRNNSSQLSGRYGIGNDQVSTPPDVSADQSGDGDNESSSSSDEEVERGGASWKREGPGKGYQRKAGHLGGGGGSGGGSGGPRSPRHATQSLSSSFGSATASQHQQQDGGSLPHAHHYHQHQRGSSSLGVPSSSFIPDTASSYVSRSRSSSNASNTQHAAVPTAGMLRSGRASPRLMMDVEEDGEMAMLATPYDHLVASYDQATRRRMGMRTPSSSRPGSANTSGQSSPTLAITPVSMSPRHSRSDLAQFARLQHGGTVSSLSATAGETSANTSRSARRPHYRRMYM